MSHTIYGKINSFCWVELFMHDEEKILAFYQKLFNWTYTRTPMPFEKTDYIHASLKEGQIAGLCKITNTMKVQGLNPHWASYILVKNTDETALKAKKLGAKVIMEPMDVMGAGRMAILEGPDGARINLWQSTKIGLEIPRNLQGMVGWNELLSADAKKAKEFYVNLFGWGTQEEEIEGMTYTSFVEDKKFVAGLMQMPKEMGKTPSAWSIYFTVDDINKSLKIAKENGANAPMPIQKLENIGSMVRLIDPNGAEFSLFEWVKQG